MLVLWHHRVFHRQQQQKSSADAGCTRFSFPLKLLSLQEHRGQMSALICTDCSSPTSQFPKPSWVHRLRPEAWSPVGDWRQTRLLTLGSLLHRGSSDPSGDSLSPRSRRTALAHSTDLLLGSSSPSGPARPHPGLAVSPSPQRASLRPPRELGMRETVVCCSKRNSVWWWQFQLSSPCPIPLPNPPSTSNIR